MQTTLFFDTPETSRWTQPSASMLKSIAEAPWKVVDLETTGLNPASKPLEVSAKDARRGCDPTLRARVATVLWKPRQGGSLRRAAFDLDLVRQRIYGPKDWIPEIAGALMRGPIIGHNIGFDLGWLAQDTDQRPSLVLDTLLLARLLRPDFPLELAEIASERDPKARHAFYVEARKIFTNKGAGTWTLDTLSAVLLDEKLDKSYQKPRNWIEPVLSEGHYDYAIGDVDAPYRLLCLLLGIEEGEDPVAAYRALRESRPDLQLVEPQIPDVLDIRLKGMPVNTEKAEAYAKRRFADARRHAQELVEMEPSLAPFIDTLADPGAGLTADLKQALGAAFTRRGLELLLTDKSKEPKVGEKDLRLVGAERNEQAKPLFDAWVALSKAQKAGSMALELKGFAERSADGRIHPFLSHGPVTGRLSASEPNSQQFPGDALFRAIIEAMTGNRIAACDYSALDVRVGAALCIRAQRQIWARYEERALPTLRVQLPGEPERLVDVNEMLDRALGRNGFASHDPEIVIGVLDARIAEVERTIPVFIEARDWAARDAVKRYLLALRLVRRFAEIHARAQLAGEPEWSALRDAFRLGLDIHTYTALKMRGDDPAALFAGKSKDEVATLQKQLKEELGGLRKSGKVANLGLLYAMLAPGFRDYANKVFNMGWDLEYATEVRDQWLDAYPEVDLWHCWTELNPAGRVWLPERGRNGNMPRDYFEVETLGGRRLIAFGLNAALAYPDQGSGADIIGTALQILRTENPDVFHTAINQVHDELVFEIPTAHEAAYAEVIAEAMSRAGNQFTMPYGVPIDADTLVGDVWMKD